MTVVVLMGVAGSGKSTVGPALADRLGCEFVDGDLLHPQANIAKMSAGQPLTDADRDPWLTGVRAWISTHADGVIACSALKRRYRDVLRDEHVVFVHLNATLEQLHARLAGRTGHFMPAALLDSQLADLEPPEPDERATTVDATKPPADQVARILEVVRAQPPHGVV